MSGPSQSEVVVAGGGLVGLTLAIALVRSDRDLAVTVVDRAPPDAATSDRRASAVAAAAKRMLEILGVWGAVSQSAEPIREMIVTDSRYGDKVRPTFLTFDGALEDGEPFAHMVPNGVLKDALYQQCLASGVTFAKPDGVAGFVLSDGAMEVELASGAVHRPALLVAADGGRSRLRERAGIRTVSHPYSQAGLVATIAHSKPHHGRAEEHFLPAGPFAVLPLAGDRSSLVWTEDIKTAESIAAADTPHVNAEITRRIGHHLGTIEIEDRIQSFPLGLIVARKFVRERFCLVGDAAHSIHPLAGQGLNLGLRDVAALAETIVEARRLGLDFGSVEVLARYQRWRRFDTTEMGALTDVLNRLFSNDNPALRLVRDVGLGVVDRFPALKSMMIAQASGDGADIPRLLMGEAL